MTEAEVQLALIYNREFDSKDWTVEGHIAGLKAVFAAGAKAASKAVPASTTGSEQP